MSEPVYLGPGAMTLASSGSGDFFGVLTEPNLIRYTSLIVPLMYVSGTPLSGSSTYDNATITSLGLLPGTYTYTWGAGVDADFLTINIGSVPEPSTLLLTSIAAVVGLGACTRRRRSV
jgi:hypothetical protein